MRALDPNIFNNNEPYRIAFRFEEVCEHENINSFIENGWIMIPTKEDADILAKEVMDHINNEFNQTSTIVLTGDILWQACALEINR